MEIKTVNFNIWLSPGTKGKKFTCCEDTEKLLNKIKKLIEEEGYYIPEDLCGKNPSLFIATK